MNLRQNLLRIFQLLGIQSSDGRMLDERSVAVTLQMLMKVGPMLLRGLYHRLFFRKARGLLLIGKQVTIRNPQYISTGRNVVAEDFCEIQGLSRRGIHLGDNVTIGRFAMIRERTARRNHT